MPNPSIIVGLMKYPFLHLPSIFSLFPPNKIVPPSFFARLIYDDIFSKCSLLTIAPKSLSSKFGSPIFNLLASSINFDLNFSYMFSWT